MVTFEDVTRDTIDLYRYSLGKKVEECSTALSYLYTSGGSERYFYSVVALYELLLPTYQKNIDDPLEQLKINQLKKFQEKRLLSKPLNAIQRSKLKHNDLDDMFFNIAHPIKKKIMVVLESKGLLMRTKSVGKGGGTLDLSKLK